MDSQQTSTQELTETGTYEFRRQLDDACVACIQERFNRPLTAADVNALMDAQS